MQISTKTVYIQPYMCHFMYTKTLKVKCSSLGDQKKTLVFGEFGKSLLNTLNRKTINKSNIFDALTL